MVLLLEAAQRFMLGGAAALEKGQTAQAFQQIGKASDIVMELWRTLDRARAPELCAMLEQVYEFTAVELTKATATRSAQHARNAERAFAPLVEAFQKAVAEVMAA